MRLEVSRKADLATRALVELGRSQERAKSSDLAALLGTTPGFLTQVVAPLTAMGWVQSDPGPTGGYSATISLDDISVLDVIEAVEGLTDTGQCVLEDRSCGDGICALHEPWATARTHLVHELASTPLRALGATAVELRP